MLASASLNLPATIWASANEQRRSSPPGVPRVRTTPCSRLFIISLFLFKRFCTWTRRL